MEFESNAKTVKGLSIAVLVLSILGIVFSLVCAIGSTALSAVAYDYIDNNGSIVYNAINSDEEASATYQELKEELSGITTDKLQELADIVRSTTADELNELGNAIALSDNAQIKAILKHIKQETGLDFNAKELAESLSEMSAAGDIEVSELLNGVTDEDIDEVADALDAITDEDIEDFNALIGSAEDGTAETAAVAVVLVIIWIIVIFEIIACIASLVAGVLGMRNSNNPNKLTGAFVWGIIAAVLAFLAGRIVTMVLLIVAVVLIAKIRKYRDGQVPPAANPVNTVPPTAPEA